MSVVTIGNATLYHGDCLEILPTLPKVDALVTDPPYGMCYDTDSTRFTGAAIGRGPGRNDREIHGDDKPFDPTPWLDYDHVVLFGANHYAQRLPTGTSLVWLKRSPQHYGAFLSDAEIAWEKGGHGVYVFYAEDSNGRRQKEMTGSPFGGSTSHPTQKPVALMEWCLSRNTCRGVTLDPFMGSGTTGVACMNLGRKFIGIEIERKYFDIACERIENAQRQQRNVRMNCSHCPNPIDRKTFFHLCRKCRGIPDMKHNYEQRKLGKYVGAVAAKFLTRASR